MQRKAVLPLRDAKSSNANQMKALCGKEALVKLLRWHFGEASVLFSQVAKGLRNDTGLKLGIPMSDRIYVMAEWVTASKISRDPPTDSNEKYARPVLGGSTLPYPRRGRTGRPPTNKDPKSEKWSDFVYLPRDEAFGHLKSSDFLTYGLKSVAQDVMPVLTDAFDANILTLEFGDFAEVDKLYTGGITLPTNFLSKFSPLPVLKEILRTDGEQFLKYPPPKVMQVNKSAWMTDEKFSRETLAGVNPNVIKSLEEFPPGSKLDSKVYGDHTSTMKKEHLEPNLGGLTVEQPLAIELSKPHPQREEHGPVSDVYLPTYEGVEGYI
ncbi:Linoleate 9S-lipoxygenase [Arachis hypogaea]|nr:Linoleate 9S-lipoxygenase [Arachis hypogaea]